MSSTEPRMPFGMHQGKPVSEVPVQYLSWFLRTPDLKSRYPDVAARVQQVSSQRETPPSASAGPVEDAAFPVYGRLQGRHHYPSAPGVAPGTLVELRRDAVNAFDGNALEARVDGQLVGYLDRELAEAVACHIDAGLIEVQGTVCHVPDASFGPAVLQLWVTVVNDAEGLAGLRLLAGQQGARGGWKENRRMPFGKHKGEFVGDLPARYAHWLWKAVVPSKPWLAAHYVDLARFPMPAWSRMPDRKDRGR